MATLEHVNAGGIPWGPVTETPDGLPSPADVFPIHRYESPDCPSVSAPHNSSLASANGQWLTVGAYWQCGFTGPSSHEGDDDDSAREAAGGDFFRPTSRCKMRSLRWDYCPVCEAEIAGEIRTPPLYVD